MFNWLSPAIESLERISVPLLFSISIFLSILIFSPNAIQQSLGIDVIVDKWRSYLGIGWLLAISLLAMRLLSSGISALKRYLTERQATKQRIRALERLTGEEKGYLTPFISGGKNTIYVGLDDGVMGGLVSKKICYQAAQQFDLLEGMAFNLQPWASVPSLTFATYFP